MKLGTLKLWNFRKFGSDAEFNISNPNLTIKFRRGVNLLIGENDSGKTAIIDAIKLVLKTHSTEWIKVEQDDFYNNSSRLRIECTFYDFTDEEASNFNEWLGWTEDTRQPLLNVFLDVSRTEKRIFPADIRAGFDEEGNILSASAKDKLKTTYLRPLRDAVTELSPKRNSRLSQILYSHEAFRDKTGHRLINLSQNFNREITSYFKGEDATGTALPVGEQDGKNLKDVIDEYLGQFSGKKSHFQITESDLKSILESLCLLFQDGNNLGLGSHNLLCIASELLHLQKPNWDGLRLGIIEEIEAHLHPQVQMQVMETLQLEAAKNNIQLILTTHSPNIGSKIKLENLFICQDAKVYPMGKDHTHLEETDYTYLQRFLDVTKANLFFARGIILVEGWSEELILPVFAEKLGINLTTKGVSVINIASTAFLRYSAIFKRRADPALKIKVAIITDVDVKPIEVAETKEIDNPEVPGTKMKVLYTQAEIEARISTSTTNKQTKYNGQVVAAFVSPYWTLEYCIAKSSKLRKLFYKSVLEALKEQKIDEEVRDLTNYNNAITHLDTYFNNWTDSDDSIAFAIINHILNGKTTLNVAKDKISKSIIAQRFAENLKSDATIADYRTETSLEYIFQAIDHATNN